MHYRWRILYLFLFLSLVTGQGILAQTEELSPLLTNPALHYKKEKKEKLRALTLRTYPDIYVYELDTIALPVVDDFSTDLFRAYDAQPGDPNVTAQKYWHLMQGATPMNDTVKFMSDTTYSILVDTLPNGSDTIYYTPLPFISITVNDLNTYPISGTPQNVWPRYNIIDTAYLPSSPDTIYINPPDLVQDSVNVYFVTANDPQTIWIDQFAYLNTRYAVNPVTIGVATFDGVDDTGYPYQFALPTAYGVADYLTSKPINLSYPAGDSVYLGFFYQPQGLGDAPESTDSLVLEFFSPVSLQWEHIWAVPGTPLDTFEHVIIPITASKYLQNGFRFRFKNYATLSGNLDHWNLDYVELRRFASFAGIGLVDDVAFRHQGYTLLKNYTSMPWKHFKWSLSSNMQDTVSVFERNNNDVSARLIGGKFMKVYYKGVQQVSVPDATTPSINPSTNFKSVFNVLNAGYTYDTTVNDTCASFEVMFTHNTTPDERRENDTMRFTQDFINYYAYDDGTAEAAYGPQGAFGKLAYKFTIAQSDTLRSVQMSFSPSVNNVTSKPFYLTIWDATGSGGSPGNIIYQNTNQSFPVYENTRNGFHEYHFETWQLVSGTFYVGYEQVATDKLNIGFDFNRNSQTRIYYNISGNWNMTGFQGSLLMRPVFTSKKDYLLGIEVEDNSAFREDIPVKIYPNPATDMIMIECGLSVPFRAEIMDLSGRIVQTNDNVRSQISVAGLTDGMYLIRLSSQNKQVITRILVQR